MGEIPSKILPPQEKLNSKSPCIIDQLERITSIRRKSKNSPMLEKDFIKNPVQYNDQSENNITKNINVTQINQNELKKKTNQEEVTNRICMLEIIRTLENENLEISQEPIVYDIKIKDNNLYEKYFIIDQDKFNLIDLVDDQKIQTYDNTKFFAQSITYTLEQPKFNNNSINPFRNTSCKYLIEKKTIIKKISNSEIGKVHNKKIICNKNKLKNLRHTDYSTEPKLNINLLESFDYENTEQPHHEDIENNLNNFHEILKEEDFIENSKSIVKEEKLGENEFKNMNYERKSNHKEESNNKKQDLDKPELMLESRYDFESNKQQIDITKKIEIKIDYKSSNDQQTIDVNYDLEKQNLELSKLEMIFDKRIPDEYNKSEANSNLEKIKKEKNSIDPIEGCETNSSEEFDGLKKEDLQLNGCKQLLNKKIIENLTQPFSSITSELSPTEDLTKNSESLLSTSENFLLGNYYFNDAIEISSTKKLVFKTVLNQRVILEEVQDDICSSAYINCFSISEDADESNEKKNDVEIKKESDEKVKKGTQKNKKNKNFKISIYEMIDSHYTNQEIPSPKGENKLTAKFEHQIDNLTKKIIAKPKPKKNIFEFKKTRCRFLNDKNYWEIICEQDELIESEDDIDEPTKNIPYDYISMRKTFASIYSHNSKEIMEKINYSSNFTKENLIETELDLKEIKKRVIREVPHREINNKNENNKFDFYLTKEKVNEEFIDQYPSYPIEENIVVIN